MVVLCQPALIGKFSQIKTFKPTIPVIDLWKPEPETLLVNACEEFGFFKVVNHGVPVELMRRVESEALNFFGLPQHEKDRAGPPDPFGYGNRRIGPNGDVGWVEHLLLTTNLRVHSQKSIFSFPEIQEDFRRAVEEYTGAVKRTACEVVEMVAKGLEMQERNGLSKLLRDEESDSAFRLNHYPPSCRGGGGRRNMIGFGEHTDPHIVSVLKSNNISGLQISLVNGTWLTVPPDRNSLFFLVGDSLQVMTNGRFRSVKHRVVTENKKRSRVSMVYFGGPPLNEKIAPLMSLMEEGEERLYREFTWDEYKKAAYNSRLADCRLLPFEIKTPPPPPLSPSTLCCSN